MPNKESDPKCNDKKRHIGNDYVTITYNDSSEDYSMGTLSVRRPSTRECSHILDSVAQSRYIKSTSYDIL